MSDEGTKKILERIDEIEEDLTERIQELSGKVRELRDIAGRIDGQITRISFESRYSPLGWLSSAYHEREYTSSTDHNGKPTSIPNPSYNK